MRLKPACNRCALILILLPFTLSAAPVDPATATQTAQQLLSRWNTGHTLENIFAFPPGQNTPAGYVCTLQPTGYLVLSGDDNLPPLLAFARENSFGVLDSTRNPLLDLLIADIEMRLSHSDLLSEEERADRCAQWRHPDLQDGRPIEWWPPEGSTTTEGWIETNWTQNAPYNNFCPIDLNSGSRSLAGCPAIAMAQILNYHRTLRTTRLADWDDYHHNYGGNNYWIDDDWETYEFPSFPQLNNCLDTLEAHWQEDQPLTSDDKAALVFACGVAARQVYNPAGSGTFGVSQAWTAWVRFNFPEIRFLTAESEDLYEVLAENMQSALPVHFAVVTPAWDMGHNVVLDGYNSDGYFHLNFGWGGSYNGWYLLPEEIPYGLTVVEGAICDIGRSAEQVPRRKGLIDTYQLNNHPNPFNPSTTVTFQLTEPTDVKLTILNTLGQEVAVLTEGILPAGMHQLDFQATDLPAAIYFSRLQTPEEIYTRKMLLVK